VSDDGSAGTAMLGLGGFVLLAVSSAFGELEQAVETTATTAWCQGCGVAAVAHGRRPVRVRDLPSSGRPVTLLWLKRLRRCAEPACAVRTWSETSETIRGLSAQLRRGCVRQRAEGAPPSERLEVHLARQLDQSSRHSRWNTGPRARTGHLADRQLRLRPSPVRGSTTRVLISHPTGLGAHDDLDVGGKRSATVSGCGRPAHGHAATRV
jgi:hypothetical protein